MIQLNQQIPEKQTHRGDGVLEVHSIFYTIQGEGPFAGEPAVFVRLAGCNLQCPDCDTIYADQRTLYSPAAVLDHCLSCLPHRRFTKMLVVITGGEPFRQNIWPTVRELGYSGIRVQVETNGTLRWAPDESPCITTTIVCSPKKSYIVEEIRGICKHLKYVCEAGKISEEDGLPVCTMGYGGQVARPWFGFNGTIWLQPLDAQDPVQNKANVDATVAACMKFGYRLSVQSHKIVGVP